VDEKALEQAFALGKKTWPSIDLAFDTFRAHCEHVLGEAPDWDWLRHAGDLYLCCACATGNTEATRSFDAEALPPVVKAINRIDSDPQFVDDVLQTLRDRLLVGPRPKIGDYAARGPLVAWLSVAAARAALDSVRSRKARRIPHADLPDRLAQSDTSPLDEIVKSRYADSFQSALKQAIVALPSRERNLLRLQLIGRCSIDQLGRMYLVHRATAARWLESARNRVYESVREQMKLAHHLTDGEFDSIARGVRSQLDLNITATISGLTPDYANSSGTDAPDPDPGSEADSSSPLPSES